MHLIDSSSAKVVLGRLIGRKIGFPSANLDITEKDVHLNNGVYGVKKMYQIFGLMR